MMFRKKDNMLGITLMMGCSGDFMVIAMDLMRYSYHEIFT
jgi:hypothetical protein